MSYENKKQLSRLYKLNREYDKQTENLLNLNIEKTRNVIRDGEPCETYDLESMIRLAEKQRELTFASSLYELKRLYRYIGTVPDSRIRLILSLRYINALSWEQVATCIDSNLTADDVKRLHDRFLKQNTNGSKHNWR